MTPERWRLTETILGAVLDAPAGTREAVLAERCAGDAALSDDVRSLLAAHDAADRWTAATNQDAGPPAPLDRSIGPYRLERLLGRGGMGVVYLAHRASGDFDQKVAVKVIGLPFDLEAFRDRFRRERQILAGLNHPNITHLLDGGITPDGELYLVMEFVDGVPLDAYLRQHELGDAAHLRRLFLPVCDAVAYAHQRLIIHRDLKPSNILVSTEGVVKLLDFGTARVLGDEEALAARTQTGMGLVTAAYASPEQLRGDPASTFGDIFSLGAVLYEILCGQPAFTSNITSRLNRDAALALPVPLSGDLDRIVRKALAPDVSHRYVSVAQLADDVRHYLEGRAVLAHGPGLLYRGRKFVRRHVWSVSIAGVSAIALTAAAIFSLAAARTASHQADRAERINAFLVDMLGSPDPSWYNTLQTKGKNVTVLDVLDELGGRIDHELASQPDVAIELRRTIGRMYSTLGQHQQARDQLSLALAKQSAGSSGAGTETARIEVALATENYFTQHLSEAVAQARAALAIVAHLRGRESRQTLMEADNVLAVSLSGLGSAPSEVEAPVRESVAISRELFGDGGSTPVTIGTLASLKLEEGQFDEAVTLANEALAMDRARPGSPGVEALNPLRDLGLVAIEREDYAAAEKYLTDSLAIAQAGYGPDGLYTDGVRAARALAVGLSGRHAEAEPVIKARVQHLITLAGPSALLTAMVEESLGRVQLAAGEFVPAETTLRHVVEIFRQRLRSDDVRLANAEGRLGECLVARQKRDEALPLLTDSYHTLVDSVGADHIWTRRAQMRLEKARGPRRAGR